MPDLTMLPKSDPLLIEAISTATREAKRQGVAEGLAQAREAVSGRAQAILREDPHKTPLTTRLSVRGLQAGAEIIKELEG